MAANSPASVPRARDRAGQLGCSTSRGGSDARAVTPSASIALVPRTPPLIRTILLYGRVASRTAFAVPASSDPNAIAVGPSSSGLSASADGSVGGDPHQPVLDDVIRDVLLRSARRISAISLTLRPRYSLTMNVRARDEILAQLRDRLPLGLCRHVHLLASAAAGARRGQPMRPCDADRLREVPLASQGRNPPGVVSVDPASACSPSSPASSPRGDGDRSGPADQAPTVATRRRARRPRAQAVCGDPFLQLSAARLADATTAACRCRRGAAAALAAAGDRRREERRDVDLDAGAHRAGDRQALQVLALRARRLGAVDCVDQGARGWRPAGRPRSCPCRRDVDEAALVDLELDAAGLDLPDRPIEVERDRARLRVRHEAAAAEDLAEPADHAHHVGRREGDVELEPAGLDLLDQVLGADLVGAGAERFLGLVALGEDSDPDDLAGAVRQDDRAADHLVGVARVDAEAEVRLDRRVELDGARLLGELDGLGGRVDALAVDELRGVLVFLAVSAMCVSFLSAGSCRTFPFDAASRGRGRAVASGVGDAASSASRRPRCPCCGRCPRSASRRASMSLALRSGILVCGDLAELVAGDPADGLATGRGRRPSRRRRPCGAGPRRAAS